MKNAKRGALLALAAAMMTGACALAEGTGLRLTGEIEPGRVLTLLAPYSGRVEDFTAREGDCVAAGEALFAIDAKELRAEFDGKVTGVFAQGGDSAEGVQARYGALMYIERDEPFRAECSTGEVTGENEQRVVHVGETVYVRAKDNHDREGVARVIGAAGREYTIEVYSSDGLRLSETVEVYRSAEFRYADRIGAGRLTRIDPVAVTAEGYVLEVLVQDGQRVSRGDVLARIVPDELEGMRGGDGTVAMPQDGILLSVTASSGEQIEKDAPMATYCVAGEMQLVCPADEEDLAALKVGALMRVTPDADEGRTIAGQVTAIAGASGEDGRYDVTIALEETDGLRIGMGATAETVDAAP